jgi:hypothetical protein
LTLFPELSVDVNDVFEARALAIQLKNDIEFFNHCSHYAKKKIKDSFHLVEQKWLEYIYSALK